MQMTKRQLWNQYNPVIEAFVWIFRIEKKRKKENTLLKFALSTMIFIAPVLAFLPIVFNTK